MILVNNGEPLPVRMWQSQVELEDIMYAARSLHGLEKMDKIKYAVLKKDGTISIIPKKKDA